MESIWELKKQISTTGWGRMYTWCFESVNEINKFQKKLTESFLTFGNVIISSLVTRNGSVNTPKFAIKNTKERLAKGIQLKFDEMSMRKLPWRKKINMPKAIPNADKLMRKRRPVLSTRNVEEIAPISWMIPTIILDDSGDKLDPESLKTFATKNCRAKTPLNCSRNWRTTPISKTFLAGFDAMWMKSNTINIPTQSTILLTEVS